MRWLLVVCFVVLMQTTAHAQSGEYYYYNPDGVGAHAFYNPQNFIVQGGLGAVYNDRLDKFNWSGGFHTVNRSLFHPIHTIDEYGWGRFMMREFVPHLGPGQSYIPNWLWHFGGGGMRTKLMEEYYRHHEVRLPRLWAWATMYTLHYVNELVQAAKFDERRYSIDPLPDMLFFDWLGGVFFRFDPINRVMSRTLHMREWSYQAQYNPLTRRLFNNGQLYWLRYEIWKPLSISFLTGEQISSLNLTLQWGGGRQISVGAGPQTKSFIAKKNGDTDPSEITYEVGVYYSIDDNPFVVFSYEPKASHNEDHNSQYRYAGKAILNFYPALVQLFGQRVGMTVAYHEDSVYFGISMGVSPGGLMFSSMPVINDP